ncbi:MAG: tetratricopeptide repeat protein [Verrucomicrobia bacterium]|jgi:protein O-mannosyl-transferase|nr:tetratricopeptide repeat protein [Verrucomicrobiota bacterium]MBT7067575.1 tetratricopeptide repeat protein [Verrucomicrobiota bacterium]MBT7702374.1 tetratricopeptide repeat protein [Verrucomicrobiota bacterium]
MKHPLKCWLPPLLLILAGVLAYWNSFDGVFVYDDLPSILDNPHIRVLWPLSEAMSLPLWSSALTVDSRPLLSLSFALNHWLFGPEPWGYHLVDLIIHLAAGLLLFGIVRRTLELPRFRERYAQSGTWLALASALIWLVHPLQTESVTYIVQRAESLMGMLFLLTVYCAIRGIRSQESGVSPSPGLPTSPGLRRTSRRAGRSQSPKNFVASFVASFVDKVTDKARDKVPASSVAGARRWYVAAILACAIGMGVKQTMFSAPLLVILYDYIFTGGLEPDGLALGERGLQRAGHVARARLPSVASEARRMGRARGRFYAALCSTWLIVFGIIGLTWNESTSDFVTISPLRYALTQPLVLLHYLRLAIWPDPLVLAYGWPLEDQWPRIVFPALVILGLLAVMLRGLWRRSWYGFLIAWFFLILAPTSSVAPMRQAIFEHRMYLPLAAVIMLAVVGGEYVIRKLVTDPKRRAVLGACLAMAIVTLFGYLTHVRNRDYHSAIRIWQNNIAHQPESHVAHTNLGYHLRKAGRYAEAARHLQTALQLKPNRAAAHYNLGRALRGLGRTREAIAHYQQALRADPGLADAHYDLGNALRVLGRHEEAIGHYRQAVQLKPDYADAYNNWGVALDAAGRPQEAVVQYQHAVRIDPGLPDAHYNLGNALFVLGRHEEAVEYYRQAVQLKPDYADAYNNWGVVCQADGRFSEAITHFEQALRLKPDYTAARENLRKTREMMKRGLKDEG